VGIRTRDQGNGEVTFVHSRIPTKRPTISTDEGTMTETQDIPCAVSQELLNLQCLQCGEIISGSIIAIIDCRRCGALDYHIFRGYVALDDASHNRRAVSPDNKDVINKMIELVQRQSNSGGKP
jgi:hypothetical protein